MDHQCFSAMKNQTKLLLNFYEDLQTLYKNGNRKDCKFVILFWRWVSKIFNNKVYVIDSKTAANNYSHENPIKFLTDSIESSLCDYSDAYILATGDVVVKNDYNADLAAAT